jgi:hypothetical protein
MCRAGGGGGPGGAHENSSTQVSIYIIALQKSR